MKKLTSVVALSAVLALMPLQVALADDATQVPSQVSTKVPEIFQLNYDDIQKTLLARNPTVKTNQDMIDAAQNGSLSVEEAKDDMGDSASSMQRAISKLKQSEQLPGADVASIETQIGVLRGSVANFQNQTENLENQADDASKQAEVVQLTAEMVNQQLVLGTQNLFFANDSLKNQDQIIQNSLTYLQKSLEALKLRQSLGMSVDLDVKNSEQQIDDLKFQDDQIKRQLDTIRGQVNVFIGQDFNHQLELSSPSLLNADIANNIDYKKDLSVVKVKSYTLKLQEKSIEAKELALDHAEEMDGLGSYSYNSAQANVDAEQIKFEDATKKVNQAFDSSYNDVQDKLQAAQLEQSRLDNMKTKFNNAQLSNQLGLLSDLDLAGVTSDYNGQVLKAKNAQEDFTKAYNTYHWLTNGISTEQ